MTTIRTFKFQFTAAFLAATACLVHASGPAPQEAAHKAHAPHWSYAGAQGASHWGNMEPGFAECKLGKEQSPIDIRGAKKADLKPIAFAYADGAAEVVNNGHTIQINLADAGKVTLEGVDFKLVQFHFHTPSEEKIRGKNYPLVAHLVHKSADGNLAVVAVLFKQGKENTAMKAIFEGLPTEEGKALKLAAGFNPADMLPADRGYYKYAGSLTTPPCSQGVRWQVLKQPAELSKAQIKAFQKLYKMNARPTQPLNGRMIEES